MNVLSDDLDLAIEKLLLEVEGTDAEDDLDIQTQEDFVLMDIAMELSDKLTILNNTLSEKMKQKEISNVWGTARRNDKKTVWTVTTDYCCNIYGYFRQLLLQRCQQIHVHYIKANREFKTESKKTSEK